MKCSKKNYLALKLIYLSRLSKLTLYYLFYWTLTLDIKKNLFFLLSSIFVYGYIVGQIIHTVYLTRKLIRPYLIIHRRRNSDIITLKWLCYHPPYLFSEVVLWDYFRFRNFNWISEVILRHFYTLVVGWINL